MLEIYPYFSFLYLLNMKLYCLVFHLYHIKDILALMFVFVHFLFQILMKYFSIKNKYYE